MNLDIVGGLSDFGRVRLSRSFFMRVFLYSDIAAIHGLANAPDDPELAIAAGKRLSGRRRAAGASWRGGSTTTCPIRGWSSSRRCGP